MVDELYDRHYREARTELNAAIVRGLARLGGAIGDVFEVLVGIEYETPWTVQSKRARCN
jgi:hypothetical protein